MSGRICRWLCLLLCCGAEALWLVQLPNPRRDWSKCGRSGPSFVCDPQFVLERGNAEKLDRIAQEFRTSTLCPCSECPDKFGVPIGVFIRRNLTDESLFQYPSAKALAEALRKRWSLSPCDGDIIIVLITELNISDFSMGPAVQSVFPAETADRIVADCRVHFESGWFYQGLESILNSFEDELFRLQRKSPKSTRGLVTGIALGVAVLLILAAAAAVILHRQSQKRKEYCDDIYDGKRKSNNRRQGSFDQEEHLERLRGLNSGDDEEEEDEDDSDEEGGEFSFHPTTRDKSDAIQFKRVQRQLSDVAEETEEMLKRNSANTSFASSSKFNHVPITEL